MEHIVTAGLYFIFGVFLMWQVTAVHVEDVFGTQNFAKREMVHESERKPRNIQIQNFLNYLKQRRLIKKCRGCNPLYDPNTLNLVRLANGNLYYLSLTDVKSWEDANKTCNSYGMHLVTLETQQENTLVNQYVYSKLTVPPGRKKRGFSVPTPTLVWMGLTGDNSTPRVYTWITNNQVPTYTAWVSSPYTTPCGALQYNAATRIPEGWNTDVCSLFYPYLCEMDSECKDIVSAVDFP